MAYQSFLIKPASGLCNMRCRYCFYEDESNSRSQKSMGIMTKEIADQLLKRVFDKASSKDVITFTFQGGEPTLAGMEYFRHFVEQVERLNKQKAVIHYSLQTNGLQLDEEWIAFLKEHHFLVGVSVDGDRTLHDSNRIDSKRCGTFLTVTGNLKKLIAAGVDCNLLCVVTKKCAKNPLSVYQSLKKIGTGYLQFISCLDPIEQDRGTMPYSLLPAEYGHFLCQLFDAWYQDYKRGRYTSIRMFDDLVHLAMGMPASTCQAAGSCGSYFVVEADGSVYPCDFYVLDEWRLGTIQEQTLSELSSCEKASRFLLESTKLPAGCSACRWFALCHGGCKRDRLVKDGLLENYYCSAFQMLFSHAEAKIKELAMRERGF